MAKIIIIISFFCLTNLNEASAASIYYLNSQCASGSHAIDCYQNDLLASVVELKAAENNITIRIKKWHEMHDIDLDIAVDIALKRLEESNKAFIHYRFTQCSFSQVWGGGEGVASSSRIYPCEAYLNRQRAEQLNNANIANYSITGE